MKDDHASSQSDDSTAIEARIREFRAIRKEAGLKIDPETAEVEWTCAQTLDPYGLYPEAPVDCVGRAYFARSPGSDAWVSFDDLPDQTREVLWEKHRARLLFPAGLEPLIRLRRPSS